MFKATVFIIGKFLCGLVLSQYFVYCRRLIEVLTGCWSLSSELRVPAISRLQKIHNVAVVFNELARSGVIPEWKGFTFLLMQKNSVHVLVCKIVGNDSDCIFRLCVCLRVV